MHQLEEDLKEAKAAQQASPAEVHDVAGSPRLALVRDVAGPGALSPRLALNRCDVDGSVPRPISTSSRDAVCSNPVDVMIDRTHRHSRETTDTHIDGELHFQKKNICFT